MTHAGKVPGSSEHSAQTLTLPLFLMLGKPQLHRGFLRCQYLSDLRTWRGESGGIWARDFLGVVEGAEQRFNPVETVTVQRGGGLMDSAEDWEPGLLGSSPCSVADLWCEKSLTLAVSQV